MEHLERTELKQENTRIQAPRAFLPLLHVHTQPCSAHKQSQPRGNPPTAQAEVPASPKLGENPQIKLPPQSRADPTSSLTDSLNPS